MKKDMLEQYKKAYREIVKEEERRGFISHLISYIFINAGLIFINLMYSPEFLWFVFPLTFWGIGLIMHYLYAIKWLERILREREAKAEYRIKEI